MTTATTLRDLRRRSGLSQAQIARRVGITASVLSAYENGRREPAADTFLAVVKATGFEPHWSECLDDRIQGRRLVQVLELAEALPYTARPLANARYR